MKKLKRQVLLVDDDPQNNFLSKMVLKISLGTIEVTDFVVPEVGLEYIESEFIPRPDGEKTTLLLDINMPTMSGWEFLEKFDNFKEHLKKQFSIYILSSSVDPSDIRRAKQNPLVVDFIEKPLTKATVLRMFG